MLIQNVRLAYPDLFVATAKGPGDKKKYRACFILPKDHAQLPEIRVAIEEAAKAKYGDDWKTVLKSLPSDKKGMRDGIEKADKGGFGEDVLFFNASNDKRPGVYDRDKSMLVADDGRPYAGCYVNAEVEFWAMQNEHGRRINASLRGVQFREDGEAFGGGGAPASADEFPDMSDMPAASSSEQPAAADDWL